MNRFFSPTDWQKQRAPLSLLPECDACGIFKTCHTPYMKVTGKGKLRTLLIAEAPGENEDLKGIQLVGNAGAEITRILDKLGVDMREDCWLTNALICRPKDERGDNRKPTAQEITYCRPNLAKTLSDLQPDIIIPMGVVAVKSIMPLIWKDGEVDDVGTWVSWRIPSQRINAWVCPTYHPSFLLRSKDPVAEFHVTKHLRAAFSLKDKPWKKKPEWNKLVRVEMNPDKASEAIACLMAAGRPMAFDFETTTLKPDGPHAEIICCSVSDGEISVAFPWHGRAIETMRIFVQSRVPKIAANLRMEDRWVRKKLGVPVNNWQWDTVTGAHWRDCRSGVCSLKFQSFVLFGMEDYDYLIEPYKKSKDSNCNSPNRLREVDPFELMKYCAYDSLLEVKVAEAQRKGGW